LVVSVGAAPGGHRNYLSQLFPHLSFDLIDSAEFAVSATDRIRLRQEMFTDELAHEYAVIAKTRPVLFDCDIRTQFTGSWSWDEFDEGVKRDMNDQMRWHLIIKPQASMLKFRLPFEQGTTTYLKGELKLQLWAPRRGTECRLIVDRGDEMQIYDHQELDAAMAHFKNIERTTYYAHDMDDAEGIDHCYDCRAELFVLEQYVRQVNTNIQDEEVRERVKQLSKDISRNSQQTLRPPIIDTLRTLAVIPKKRTY
jgi:cap2 methyltransferase